MPKSEPVADVMTNALSQTERDTIVRFANKRQGFPGPSNSEVRATVEILLCQSCSQTNVLSLLGKPTSVSTADKPDTAAERWAYDIGDSRRIEILFSTEGKVKEIVGIGVGFGKLKLQSQVGVKQKIAAEPEK